MTESNLHENVIIKPIREWELRFEKDSSLVFLYIKAPNIFNRYLQKIFLGFTWTRKEKE